MTMEKNRKLLGHNQRFRYVLEDRITDGNSLTAIYAGQLSQVQTGYTTFSKKKQEKQS